MCIGRARVLVCRAGVSTWCGWVHTAPAARSVSHTHTSHTHTSHTHTSHTHHTHTSHTHRTLPAACTLLMSCMCERMKEASTGSRMRTISICMMHTRTHKPHTHASHTNYTHTHHTHTHHTQTTHTQTTHTHFACHSHAANELHVWTYERSLHWITHAYNLNLYDAHTHTQTTHTRITHKLHTHASHTRITHKLRTHTHTHFACHSHAANELHVWTHGEARLNHACIH